MNALCNWHRIIEQVQNNTTAFDIDLHSKFSCSSTAEQLCAKYYSSRSPQLKVTTAQGPSSSRSL